MQLDEVKGLLGDIVAKLTSIEDRLSAVESKMPALRVVSGR